jgi:hypothetical protein
MRRREFIRQSAATAAGASNRRLMFGEILDLPLNGRNYLQLVALTPNATTLSPSAGQAGSRQGGDRGAPRSRPPPRPRGRRARVPCRLTGRSANRGGTRRPPCECRRKRTIRRRDPRGVVHRRRPDGRTPRPAANVENAKRSGSTRRCRGGRAGAGRRRDARGCAGAHVRLESAGQAEASADALGEHPRAARRESGTLDTRPYPALTVTAWSIRAAWMALRATT